MKRNLLVICLLFALTACDKDDDNSNTGATLESLNAELTVSNGLIITTFTEDGSSEDELVNTYLFLFDSDGTVVASLGDETIEGTYLTFRDDGRLELLMNFPENSELHELNEDWYFISKTGSSINFDDDGDVLVFQQQ
ncbi:MAG: hypothetical protein WBG42_11750 [Cryomorphaceae bacterium]